MGFDRDVLLKARINEAQNISVVALYPWLMLPVIPVILTG